MTHAEIIRRIEIHCLATGLKQSTFGLRAVNDGKLIDRLRRGKTITLAGYERVDVRAAWTAVPGFDVFLEIENLTNNDHREAVGFESAGIAPRVGIALYR